MPPQIEKRQTNLQEYLAACFYIIKTQGYGAGYIISKEYS